jgi:hypothetical protein
VAYLGDPADLPGVLIVPLQQGADANAIEGLLVSGKSDGVQRRLFGGGGNPQDGIEAVVVHDSVLFGMIAQVETMKSVRPLDRPLLAAGLAALGDVPVKLAASPSAALQIAGGDIFPDNLPPELGGESPADLINALAWAAVGVSAQADSRVKLLVQCRDDKGTGTLVDLSSALLTALSGDPVWSKAVPNAGQLAAALKPSVQGDRISLDLPAGTIDDLIAPALVHGVAGYRRQDQTQKESLSRVRQFAMAISQYAGEHEGKFPEKLQDLADYLGGAGAIKMMLASPLDGAKEFIYIKPAQPPDQLPDHGQGEIVLYDGAAGADGRVAVMFADTHVERISRDDLQSMLPAAPAVSATTRP